MKALLALLLAFTGFYITSKVYITGPADLSVPVSTAYAQDYAIQSARSNLGTISISSSETDAVFSLDASACVGVSLCTVVVSVYSDVPGDYVATIRGSSLSGRLASGEAIRGSTTTMVVTAHVGGP